MLNITGLIYIGQMAVFYVPQSKLDNLDCGKEDRTPRELIHKFLMSNYDAYTLEISNTQGFWRKHQRGKLFVDENARYEVSFDGKDRIPSFVEFLRDLCNLMGEEAIYVTMGRHSYLVMP